MSAKPITLAILTHPDDAFRKGGNLACLMIPRWEAMGYRVVVVTDEDGYVPADVALLHVSLSVVPEAYRRLVERYPRVVNGRVLDIRKRRHSALLVDEADPDPGMVIVKTDWNSGGEREFRQGLLESPLGPLIRRFDRRRAACARIARIEARRPWRSRQVLPVDAYPVFLGRDRVPKGVWQNRNLVVERFVAEREGTRYRCRHWLFFGDREVTRRTLSDRPVVKLNARLERTDDAVPDELRSIRARLGFDYGKFDYGIVGGEVVLYDVNRTPGASADPSLHEETVAILSEGIRGFVAEAAGAMREDAPGRTRP